MNEFKNIKLGEREYTALRFGSDSYEMPPSIMQNTRENGLLVTDDGVESFPWYGVTKDTEGQYILLPVSMYEDITTLTTTHRDRALEFVRKIASALETADKSFPDLMTGIFPLYRMFIKDGKDIVLLPPDAGSILSLSRSPEETDRDVRALIVPDREKSFTLALEMVQLLYFALSGRFPYESADVRGSGFRAYDLSLYGYSDETSSFIMSALTMKEKDQRRICLNYGPQYALGWFLEKTENLGWNYPSRSDADALFDRETSEKEEAFQALKNRKGGKSKRKKIVREKGAIAAVIVLIAGIVIYFIGNYLYQELKAPLTKDLDPEGIIEYTIEKQNELDAGSINEGFKGECAQYMEVTSLYVSSRTTLAYSQKNTIINVNDWIESGRGAIDRECTIYGVIIDGIEESGENAYTAHLEYYSPYALSDEDEDIYPQQDNTARIFVYSIDENFVFEWNTRGWWLCTDSEFSDATLLDVLYVPYASGDEVASD